MIYFVMLILSVATKSEHALFLFSAEPGVLFFHWI